VRLDDRRERSTDLIVTALQQQIKTVQQQLADPAAWPALRSDATRIFVLAVRARLLEAHWEPFLAGEADEHQHSDYAAAIQKYTDLTDSPDAASARGRCCGWLETWRRSVVWPRALGGTTAATGLASSKKSPRHSRGLFVVQQA
jgi:hypothetical protein